MINKVWIIEVYGTFDTVWTTEAKAKAELEQLIRDEGADCGEISEIQLNTRNETDLDGFFDEEEDDS